jgi:hypothetical protein
MSKYAQSAIDDRLRILERRLPRWAARLSERLREASPWVRVGIGSALILGGIFSILPVLGMWMLPLGLVMIAKDVPILRSPVIRLMDWVNRKWPPKPKKPKSNQSSSP